MNKCIGQDPQVFHFLALPEFSFLAFISDIEPLRVANHFRPGSYEWHAISTDGGPVVATNGMMLALIDRKHGRALATQISDWLILGRIRSQSLLQRMEIAGRRGLRIRVFLLPGACLPREIRRQSQE